jgi:hypothetical protein
MVTSHAFTDDVEEFVIEQQLKVTARVKVLLGKGFEPNALA